MQDSAEQLPLEDLMARRLLAKVTSPTQKGRDDGAALVESQIPAALVETDFVKVETNIAALGFFTPSSNRIKGEKSKVVVSFRRQVGGQRVEGKATIIPSAIYGLPNTADQDKFLALQKLINEKHRRAGVLTNPITFTSAEILRILGLRRDTGKNYKDIAEWLRVMTGVMVISEGTIYLADRKQWVEDSFHVFDRAVASGSMLEDGTKADRHYVWLSDWQLQNINQHYQLPVDLETYRRLRSRIAKALVPPLQVWLYTTERQGVFRKYHSDLCKFLGIREYRSPAHIKRHLGGALDELVAHGYISDWKLERTEDRRDYVIVLSHGEKYHRDRQLRLVKGVGDAPDEEGADVILTASESPEKPQEEAIAPELLAALTTRGIRPKQAREALLAAEADQDVLGQLEYADQVIAESPDGFRNPPGFRLRLIQENFPVPSNFETSSQRALREDQAAATAAEREQKSKLLTAHQEYQRTAAEKHIAGLEAGEYDRRLEAKRKELHTDHPKLRGHIGEDNFTKMARNALAGDAAKELPLLSFSEFCDLQNGSTGST